MNSFAKNSMLSETFAICEGLSVAEQMNKEAQSGGWEGYWVCVWSGESGRLENLIYERGFQTLGEANQDSDGIKLGPDECLEIRYHDEEGGMEVLFSRGPTVAEETDHAWFMKEHYDQPWQSTNWLNGY